MRFVSWLQWSSRIVYGLILWTLTSDSRDLAYAYHVTGTGQIADDHNTTVALRGLSWFGFETQDFVVNGLWVHSMDFYLDMLHRHRFNLLRIPVSAEWVYYNFDLYPDSGFVSADPAAQGRKSIEIMDALVDGCAQRGIGVMFDLHRLHKEYISEVWYSPTDNLFPAEVFFETWKRLLLRYGDRPNLIAVDLLNEPHGRATWGTGDLSTDWNAFVQYAIPKLDTLFPDGKWLYVVEGIEWGHTFDRYPSAPIRLPGTLERRLVFSPHTYGKSVVPQTSDDYNVLVQNWDYFFGFLKKTYGLALMPGEWGGRTDLDMAWMQYLATYLRSLGVSNNCFWSLGPNSDDVQGLLLNDWTTVDQAKLDIIERINPTPTQFHW